MLVYARTLKASLASVDTPVVVRHPRMSLNQGLPLLNIEQRILNFLLLKTVNTLQEIGTIVDKQDHLTRIPFWKYLMSSTRVNRALVE